MDYTCLHDRARIESFLRADVGLHLYSIGDLDDFFWPYTVWFGRESEGGIDAIALLYVGMPVPTLLALGGGDSMAALLESIRHLLPLRFYAHLSPGLSDGLRSTHTADFLGLHHRMILSADLLPPVDSSPGAVRLGPDDLPALGTLYDEAYPDNWFDPRMIETGQYFGVRENSRLVSVAGIHVYSRPYRVAALGNIATLPSYRGRGYAARVTAQLCRSLTDEGLDVGLNVHADNTAAIACYRGIGFRRVAMYEEFAFERR